MTQEELAKKIGVKSSAIGNYETDYREPNIETIKKLIKVLSIDANYLLLDENENLFEMLISKEERQLIQDYHSLDDEEKTIIDK